MTALVGAPMLYPYGVRDVQMNPGWIEGSTIFLLLGAGSPGALLYLAVLSLAALLLLSFGLTHGSLPIPASAIGRALFILNV